MSRAKNLLNRVTLDESFINLFIKDKEEREKFADEVFKMLHAAYAPIGGLKTSGFESKESMIKTIPMWKLNRIGGKIKAVIMYKDTGGRKSVAIASDGTDEGKKILCQVAKTDLELKRSWKEVSGPSLGLMRKHLGPELLKSVAIPLSKVKELIKDELRAPPPDDDQVKRVPELKDFFYQREIGGHWHTKVCVGFPGLSIH